MAKAQISVVIPAFKAEATIANTVRSCFADDGVDVQVIIVEDGIFDNTREVVEALELPVKLITLEQNSGAQVARNKGFELAEHDFVMFLDSDDYIEKPLLSGLAEQMRMHDLDLVMGPMTTIDERGKILSVFVPPKNEERLAIAQRWLRGYSFPHPCGVLWRSAFIKQIGGWDETIKRNQDGEIVIRALMNKAKTGTSQLGMSYYLDHSGPRVSKGKSLATYDSQEQVLSLIQRWMDSEDTHLAPAVAEFCALVAAKAYNDGHPDIGNKWESRIQKFGGLKLTDFQLGGRKRRLRLLGYKAVGVSITERVRKFAGL